jgi:membrane protein implicated in regulation of membrane protease activity
MLPWQIWLIIAGICLIIEIATVGFLVFWFAVAALITCLLSLFIHNVIIQTAIFVVLSALLIFLTRPFANKIGKKDKVVTNSNYLIGKEGTVLKDITFNSATLGQVKVNGDVWSAVTEEDYGIIPAKSIVRILKIDGVKLVVEPLKIYSTIENSK